MRPDDSIENALATVERVRKAYPCPGLQFEVCPGLATWVIMHRGNGPRKAMPAVEAIAYKRAMRAKARYERMVKAREAQEAKDKQ